MPQIFETCSRRIRQRTEPICQQFCSFIRLMNAIEPHRIAITEKTIAVVNRMVVRIAHGVHATKGGHQHEQGRLRQMKIGNQCIHHAEPIRRADKQSCFVSGRTHLPVVVFVWILLYIGRLQSAQRGRANANHTAFFGTRLVNQLRGGLGNFIPFFVHDVRAQILRGHG